MRSGSSVRGFAVEEHEIGQPTGLDCPRFSGYGHPRCAAGCAAREGLCGGEPLLDRRVFGRALETVERTRGHPVGPKDARKPGREKRSISVAPAEPSRGRDAARRDLPRRPSCARNSAARKEQTGAQRRFSICAGPAISQCSIRKRLASLGKSLSDCRGEVDGTVADGVNRENVAALEALFGERAQRLPCA